jgi:hypothetical protein
MGWVTDLPLGVAHPMNGDSVVLQHMEITMDFRTPEHDLIIVQELP